MGGTYSIKKSWGLTDLFSSSTPCFVRISAQSWRCSECRALFKANDSVFHLLGKFDRHLRRKHKGRRVARSTTPGGVKASRRNGAI